MSVLRQKESFTARHGCSESRRGGGLAPLAPPVSPVELMDGSSVRSTGRPWFVHWREANGAARSGKP